METVLRESEQQSLLAVTTTIAGSLKGTQELLFRDDSLPAVSDGNARDITPVVLSGAPLIDGRADEWDTDSRNLHPRARAPAATRLRLLAATHERWLYLALLVRDNKVVYDASDADAARFRHHRRSHLAGLRRQARRPAASCSSAARAAGTLLATPHRNPRIRPRGSGRRSRASRRCGSARATATCSRSASRCRCSGSTSACSSTIATGAARRARATARSRSPTCAPPGRLIAASPDLNDHLRQFAQPGVELTVASSTGAILTRIDAPALPGDYTRMRGFLPRMYRLFLDGDAIPRSVSQAERQRAAEALTAPRGARQAGNRAVRAAAMKTASSSPRRRPSSRPTASRCSASSSSPRPRIAG